MNNELIAFAYWLNENTKMYAGAYEYNGKLFYTDSGKDMEELLKAYTESAYYKQTFPDPNNLLSLWR